jgi:hypothetical protein
MMGAWHMGCDLRIFEPTTEHAHKP